MNKIKWLWLLMDRSIMSPATNVVLVIATTTQNKDKQFLTLVPQSSKSLLLSHRST